MPEPMSQSVVGNTKGLAQSELRRIHKLFERRFDREEIVPLDVARELYRLAAELRRRIGILVSRDGRVEEVAIGTKDILYIPDLGRYRFGQGRLRRLRLIFSDLSQGRAQAFIPSDIYTDLEKLRLDMVVSVKEESNRVTCSYAHLLALGTAGLPTTRTTEIKDLGSFELDFATFMDELEAELVSATDSTIARGPNKAVLVGVYGGSNRNPKSSMAELDELCRTAGVTVVDRVVQNRPPDPKTLLGKGKIEEVVLRCLRLGAEIIIFDTELKPSQWRIITNSTELKVLDRSMVILDIFVQRATSSDGRLQVELAQLQYNLPRLVEKDSGLSRLSGGIGGRGPGETKLEISRRRIRDRISMLEKQIDRLGEQRDLRRRRRHESGLPLVAILGYTNVGKSTLFNAITKSTVLSENKLFATLDPAQRKLSMPVMNPDGTVTQKQLVISDTVGFIRELPSELVNAFRATLEELSQAVLLVHVLDASDPEIESRKAAVDAVLESMKLSEVPTILVLNKTDLVSPEAVTALVREYEGIPISAMSRRGLDILLKKILDSLPEPEVVAERASETTP